MRFFLRFLGFTWLLQWVVRWSRRIPSRSIVAGALGLILGLIIAALLAYPLSLLPGAWGKATPIGVSLLLGYLGASFMVMREREILPALGSYLPLPSTGRSSSRDGKVVVDTSAIIDGRIADISHTGFIPGTLLIPRFVLDELRHIADSPDPMRRNRGRRGLEMLSKLQKQSDVPLQIVDADVADTPEIDAKLVKLARDLRCSIITNDFNLNRVAELQGVQVLNINDLANALKTVVLPGEEMSIRIIQEGKEPGQGVGFLDDGTIVVVEGGRRYIGTNRDVVITRVLQTSAGRMIFAHSKGS